MTRRIFLRVCLATIVVSLALCLPAAAQTTFYLHSSATPSVSPAFSGWDITVDAVRRTMSTTKQSSAMVDHTVNDAVGVVAILTAQFVICDLAAQTIDGTVSGRARGIESSTAENATIALRVAKSASDGSGVTEMLARVASDGSTVPPEFSASTRTNRQFRDILEATSHNLTSTTINAGDCLIVEIGGEEDAGTDDTRTFTIVFGDNSATDLPADDTTTAADNPVVVFSDTITFGGGAAPVKRCMVLGVCDDEALTWPR